MVEQNQNIYIFPQADWMCLLANTREGNRKFLSNYFSVRFFRYFCMFYDVFAPQLLAILLLMLVEDNLNCQHFCIIEIFSTAHRNKSLICLPMDTPGIHLAKRIDKMGMKVGSKTKYRLDKDR